MSNNLINFEKRAKQKKNPSTKEFFSDMIEFLQDNIDILNFLEGDIHSRLQIYAKIIEKDLNDFELDDLEKDNLLENITFASGETILLNFYTEPEDNISFHVMIQYDLENAIVAGGIEKWVDDQIDSVYDMENGIWRKIKKDLSPEKFIKIMESGSPESDILQVLLEAGISSEKEYLAIKRKYGKLFSLYNITNRYMEPDFKIESDKSITLFLEPKDIFRQGFRVGIEKENLTLMQYLDFRMLECEEDAIIFTDIYYKIVGRTDDPKKMKNTLSFLKQKTPSDIVGWG